MESEINDSNNDEIVTDEIIENMPFFDEWGFHIPNHLFEINSIGKVILLFD